MTLYLACCLLCTALCAVVPPSLLTSPPCPEVATFAGAAAPPHSLLSLLPSLLRRPSPTAVSNALFDGAPPPASVNTVLPESLSGHRSTPLRYHTLRHAPYVSDASRVTDRPRMPRAACPASPLRSSPPPTFHLRFCLYYLQPSRFLSFADAATSSSSASDTTATATTATPLKRTLCVFHAVGPTESVSVAALAATKFYNDRFNGTDALPLSFDVVLLAASVSVHNGAAQQLSPRLIAAEWARKGATCDVIVGSGVAALDGLLAAVVPRSLPWIATSAPSDRRLMSDAASETEANQSGSAIHMAPPQKMIVDALLRPLKAAPSLALISTSSSDSLAAAALVRDHALSTTTDIRLRHDVTVDAAPVVAGSAAALRLRDRIAALVARCTTRHLVVTASVHDPVSSLLLDSLAATNATDTMILLFTDQALCSVATTMLRSLPGALCVDFATPTQTTTTPPTSTTMAGDYTAFDEATSSAEYRSSIADALTNDSALAISRDTAEAMAARAATTVRSFVHDAVLKYMAACHHAVATRSVSISSPIAPPSSEEIMAVSVIGTATGPMDFGFDSVRGFVPMVLRNVGSRGTVRSVATIKTAGGNYTQQSAVFVLGQNVTVGVLGRPPMSLPGTTTAPTIDEGDSDKLVVALGSSVAVLALCFGVVLFLVVGRRLCASDPRDNRHAPTDGEKPFAIVFTDVQASTALWAAHPQLMSEAVETHHAIIRRLITRYNGYEVKTIGDSFMVAFRTARPAVSFSLELQERMYSMTWPPEIDAIYNAMAEEARLDEGATDSALWSGLRVRVGVHYGSGNIVLDSVSKGYDYYGTVVNTAARAEAIGNGGQILATAEAFDQSLLEGLVVDGAVAVADLGEQELRGLTQPVQLFQLSPVGFEGRTFGPLRLSRIDAAISDSATAATSRSDPIQDMPLISQLETHGCPTTPPQSAQYSPAPPSMRHHDTVSSAMFLRTLLSPLSHSDQCAVLATLATRWRVTPPGGFSALAVDTGVQGWAVVAVATRAAQAHAAAIRAQHLVNTSRGTPPVRSPDRSGTSRPAAAVVADHPPVITMLPPGMDPGPSIVLEGGESTSYLHVGGGGTTSPFTQSAVSRDQLLSSVNREGLGLIFAGFSPSASAAMIAAATDRIGRSSRTTLPQASASHAAIPVQPSTSEEHAHASTHGVKSPPDDLAHTASKSPGPPPTPMTAPSPPLPLPLPLLPTPEVTYSHAQQQQAQSQSQSQSQSAPLHSTSTRTMVEPPSETHQLEQSRSARDIRGPRASASMENTHGVSPPPPYLPSDSAVTLDTTRRRSSGRTVDFIVAGDVPGSCPSPREAPDHQPERGRAEPVRLPPLEIPHQV